MALVAKILEQEELAKREGRRNVFFENNELDHLATHFVNMQR